MTVDEALEELKNYVKDDTSDEALAVVEDISDVLKDRKTAEEWKNKYEENDTQWRNKYRDTFFNKPTEDVDSNTDDKGSDNEDEEDEEELTFESLFKEEK